MAPKKGEKEKNQHIQVVVRSRPLNSHEKRTGAHSVVDINTDKREVTVKERLGPAAPNRTFTFDKVFGNHAKQIELYKSVVAPALEEVLDGYNCTIFAYGQTGTGKTFTMEGERSDDSSISWEDDPLSGVIPRAMHQLFHRLTRQQVEFSVRVSFLEIYNEELIDLLGAESVENPRLRIYEDASKKGTCVIQGLEEVIVRNKNEVYGILEKGRQRRQTAATILNAHSSRSHSLFMVTVHTKENSVDGDELLKCGKLNLVDLAGSECIGRSGAVDKRAREAGQINQSLLTLGRVISALVEHAPHIPYRESKLTRLLQDSLGGRTKTSIIATISPASCNLDETLSTLDYAYRAKNITNRPEINQKMTKKALMKEYTEEIERMRRDLQAARDKNGIYMDVDNYNDIHSRINQQMDTIKEDEDRINALVEELEKVNDLFSETKVELTETKTELTETTKTLEETKDTLGVTKKNLYITRKDRDEKSHLVVQHVKNETKLHEQASQLLYTSNEATNDVNGLHCKLDRKAHMEDQNNSVQEQFRMRFHENIDAMQESLLEFSKKQMSFNHSLHSNFKSILAHKSQEVSELNSDLSVMMESTLSQANSIHDEQLKFAGSGEGMTEDLCHYCEKHIKTEEGRHIEFHSSVFTQAIKKLQDNISNLSVNLGEFNEILNQQMVEQEKQIKLFVSTLSGNVERQRSLITDYTSCQLTHLETSCDSVKVMLNQQSSLNKSLSEELIGNMKQYISDAVSKVTTDIHGMVQRQNEHMTGNANELEEHIGQAKLNTHKLGDAALRELESMKTLSVMSGDDINASLSLNGVNSQANISQMLCGIENTASQTADIEVQVSSFSGGTVKNLAVHKNIIMEKLKEHQKFIHSNLENHDSHTKDLINKTMSHVETLDEKQQKLHSAFTTHVQDQQCIVDDSCKSISDWSDVTTSKLLCRDQDVKHFLKDELVTDIPTGLTPQRRDFHYPQKLTKTDRHSMILEDFRKDYILEEAITQPIPDDTFDETTASVVSRLPELQIDESESQDEGQSPMGSQHNISSDSAISTNSYSHSETSEKGEYKENTSMAPPKCLPRSKKSGSSSSGKSHSRNNSENRPPQSKNTSRVHSRTASNSESSTKSHSRNNTTETKLNRAGSESKLNATEKTLSRTGSENRLNHKSNATPKRTPVKIMKKGTDATPTHKGSSKLPLKSTN